MFEGTTSKTERKQAEEERDRFFTLSLDMLCIAKSDGYFKRVSPAFTHTLGWSIEDMLARPFLDFVHPDDRPATLGVVEQLVVRGEKVLHFENRYRHMDGSWRCLSWKAVSQPDGTIYAAARDVTEQREGEERFRTLANNMSQLAWMADEKGSIFWYNQRWFDYSGTTLDDMKGLGWQRVHHPDHVQRVVDKIRHCFVTGEVWEDTFPLRDRHGHYRLFLSRAVPIRDEQGKVFRWFGTNTDVTELRDAEEARHRLAAIVESSDDAIISKTLDGIIVSWNKGAERLFGYAAEEVIGKPLALTLPPDRQEEETRIIARLREGQQVDHFETVRQRKDGRLIDVALTVSAVRDERGAILGISNVTRDITERKTAEQAFEQLRKDQLRFKDEFLSHVSHELRSPLTAIKQFSTIILSGVAGELNKEQRQYQEIVLRNIGQLQAMIDDLLQVTRLETGKLTVELECVSIVEAVKDACNTLQETAHIKGITLSFEVPADLPHALADPTRLRQIFIILLDNAIKFTPHGGAVTVKAQTQEHPRGLLLHVADTGCGIDPEVAERIFDRLFQVSERIQTSRKGLGLGLYICKELVTRQGGLIWVKSQQDHGSVFSFTLPVFSLDGVLAPLFKQHEWPATSVALLRVVIDTRAARPSTETKEVRTQEVRDLLQRCIRPDTDVLLPKMSDAGQGRERFFIVAFVEEKGATTIANRIRKQFANLPGLQQTGVTLSVSYTMLPPFPREGETSPEAIVTRLAALIEDSVSSHITPEAIYHE